MTKPTNPFNALYITEGIGPEEFVDYFSPLLVSDTRQLFERGNIVLRGVQGTGKTMLLALLKPEIRIAYAKAARPFPVEELGRELSRFIGAGINLQDSYATAFGNRPIRQDDDEPGELAIYFGDFVNYFVVRDLLCTLNKLRAADGTVKDLGIATDLSQYDDFAQRIARDECWFGSLKSVKDFDSLKDCLTSRIRTYRSFFNYNFDEIPVELRESKTTAGEPISAMAVALWECGIVPNDVNIFVQIDQYEELLRLEQAEQSGSESLSQRYRSVIRGILARRNPSVSYRIGTRRYAWDEGPIPGSPVVAEELRNYDVVDLDQILRREEWHSKKVDVFGRFTEDVFTRRLKLAGYQHEEQQRNIANVFGRRTSPEERAKKYAVSSSRFLELEDDWSEEVKECLSKLASENPLSAKLGEAWVRQQLKRDEPKLPNDGDYPWEDRQNKKWWRKERIQLALLQIAAANKQRMVWDGKEDVMNLSYGHVLVFLSICKYVWAAWLRSLPENGEDELCPLPTVPDYLQDMGIRQASDYWYDKIREDQGGDTRKRLLSFLGTLFRKRLRDDKSMSFPGRNGFSVPVHELDSDPPVKRFLQEAAAYGFLIDKRRMPKDANKGDSWRWYLHPILCPHIQIPAIHTKEPMYVNVAKVRSWLENEKVQAIPPRQMLLFDSKGT